MTDKYYNSSDKSKTFEPQSPSSKTEKFSNKAYNPPASKGLNSKIELQVKDIIVEKLGVEESEVTLNASFTDDLGADSLDLVELIMEFEKEFGITIPDDQVERIATVGDAIAYIEANT